MTTTTPAPTSLTSLPRRARAARWGATALAAGLLLTGCGADDAGPDGAGSGGASPSTTTASPGPTTSAPETSAPPTTAPVGCPPTQATTPSGATVVQVVDVDGDGRPDQAWISGGDERAIGITTASGATFSSPISTASPIGASAVVNLVGEAATPVALVDVGREALVYSLAGCAVTPTTDEAGVPYTFDRGFGDQGTGVGCTEVDGVLHLAGLLAAQQGDGWTVTRTFVDLSEDGARATNGASEVVAQGAAESDPVVVTATEVSCGDLVAGQDGLVEPQS